MFTTIRRNNYYYKSQQYIMRIKQIQNQKFELYELILKMTPSYVCGCLTRTFKTLCLIIVYGTRFIGYFWSKIIIAFAQ